MGIYVVGLKNLSRKARYRLVGAPEVTRIYLFQCKLFGHLVLDLKIYHAKLDMPNGRSTSGDENHVVYRHGCRLGSEKIKLFRARQRPQSASIKLSFCCSVNACLAPVVAMHGLAVTTVGVKDKSSQRT